MNKPYLLIATLILSFSTSCHEQHQNELPDGGPCSYNHYYYPAVIYDIEQVNQTYCDLALLLYMNNEPDTIYYSTQANGNLEISILDSLNFKRGDTLAYEHMEITDGSCTPDIYNLLLERYNNKEVPLTY